MADVFISHSSIDKELADKVCETLEARSLKCWIAPRDIMPGSEWAVAKTALEELTLPYGIKRVEEFAFQDSENIVLHCWGESYTYEELAGFYIDEE